MPRIESARALPRGLLAAAVLLAAGSVALALWPRPTPAPGPGGGLVHWREPAAGLAEARAGGRLLLYDFTAEWCTPCRAMESEVFADPLAAARIEALAVPVRVLDRERETGSNPGAVAALQKRYGVEAFPTLVLARADGSEVGRVLGYPGPRALLDSLSSHAGHAAAFPPP